MRQTQIHWLIGIIGAVLFINIFWNGLMIINDSIEVGLMCMVINFLILLGVGTQ